MAYEMYFLKKNRCFNMSISHIYPGWAIRCHTAVTFNDKKHSLGYGIVGLLIVTINAQIKADETVYAVNMCFVCF